MAKPEPAPRLRPWIEGVAGSIGDPVRRLRFLRTVAPLVDPRGGARGRRWRVVGRVLLLSAIAVAALIWFSFRPAAARIAPAAPVIKDDHSHATEARRGADVWRVEDLGSSEVYSNGLRVDNSSCVSYRRRSYLAFPAGGDKPAKRSEPAGIVFHSTESQLAPFEAGHNQALKRIGESLLDYVRRRRCYHFLIDRFGRVYRVVAETDAAMHAGYSVWGDDRWLYVNLNESFLGIAFEAQTGGGAADANMTAAQARSGAMLTEMLRARYGIAAADCVTHAQVSVNPSNMRIGYHVDWAAGFPFAELGLPNGYAVPPPSIWAFGFEADAAFQEVAGPEARLGVAAAEQLLRKRAAEGGLGAFAYRRRLQQEYRRKLGAVRGFGPAAETDP